MNNALSSFYTLPYALPYAIGCLPLDARPVCYDMPKQLLAAAGIEAILPDADQLGNLKQPANLTQLDAWLFSFAKQQDIPWIVGLDTLLYGGLIPSRLGHESLLDLKERQKHLIPWLQQMPTMGFSSIMRIPNYNNAEEEPDYWNAHGTALYQYSAEAHQVKLEQRETATSHGVPEDALLDFVRRRERNFAMNEAWLSALKQGHLKQLLFCQDDTGPYGLNVWEAEQLQQHIESHGLAQSAWVQTGADECVSTLIAATLANGLAKTNHPPLTVYSVYTGNPQAMARYDGQPIANVVSQRLAIMGWCPVDTPSDADLILLVHSPQAQQGDHCLGQASDTTPEQYEICKQTVQQFSNAAPGTATSKPLAIADVAYANGSDPLLTQIILESYPQLENLYGYAGWNTPGNTIGTTVAMATVRLIAERVNRFQPEPFQQLLLTRFLDDSVYQATIRKTLRSSGITGESLEDTEQLNTAMQPYIQQLQAKFPLVRQSIHCTFPCSRTFEVKIAIGEENDTSDKVHSDAYTEATTGSLRDAFHA